MNSPTVAYIHRLLHRFQPKPWRKKRQDFSAFALTYILRLSSCTVMGDFVISPLPRLLTKELCAAGPLCSTGVAPFQRYGPRPVPKLGCAFGRKGCGQGQAPAPNKTGASWPNASLTKADFTLATFQQWQIESYQRLRADLVCGCVRTASTVEADLRRIQPSELVPEPISCYHYAARVCARLGCRPRSY